MERCPHCNAELPPVAYFCPICGKELDRAPGQEAGADLKPVPAKEPEPGSEPPVSQPPPPPANWSVPPVSGSLMLGPALMAGVAAGVLAGVPVIGDYCCLWTFGCGALAVVFFRMQFGRPALKHEAGRLGAISGFFGFLVAFAVAFVSHALILRHFWGMADFLREEFRQRAELMRTPNADRVMEMVNSPGGGPFLILAWIITYLSGFLLLSILGALITGAILRRRE